MCRSYSIDFAKPPCTSACGRQLTARVRPCRHRGTPWCVHSRRRISVLYRCALHLHMMVYPKVMEFMHMVLTHGMEGGGGSKFEGLDENVQKHVRQWGYCTYVAYQEEYYEAARTATYMRLHNNTLPPGVYFPPRTHEEILEELLEELNTGLCAFFDDDIVVPGLPEPAQPAEGQFLFGYRLIGTEHFDMQMAESMAGGASHYTFADIFDGVGCEMGSEGEELEDGDPGAWLIPRQEGKYQFAAAEEGTRGEVWSKEKGVEKGEAGAWVVQEGRHPFASGEDGSASEWVTTDDDGEGTGSEWETTDDEGEQDLGDAGYYIAHQGNTRGGYRAWR